MTQLLDYSWLAEAGVILGSLALGYLVERVVVGGLMWLARSTRTEWDDLLVGSVRGVIIVWFGIGGIYWALSLQDTLPVLQRVLTLSIPVLFILSLTVVGMRLAAGAVEQYARQRSDVIPSTTIVTNLVRLLVGVLGLFIILQNLNVQITPLLTALGVGGLAVALALQDTLGNLFAGVSIIVSRQVRPHDYVRLQSGEEGYVTDVKGRNTTIRTFPHQNLVIVPNSKLASAIVTNYSLPRRNMWMQVPVGVSYDSDLERVEAVTLEVARQVLAQVEGGVDSAEPKVRFTAFSDSSVDFVAQLFCAEFTDQFLLRHEFIKRLHRRFDEEGIEIPFPIRTVHLAGGGDGTGLVRGPGENPEGGPGGEERAGG